LVCLQNGKFLKLDLMQHIRVTSCFFPEIPRFDLAPSIILSLDLASVIS
jgi:hypothetical protein